MIIKSYKNIGDIVYSDKFHGFANIPLRQSSLSIVLELLSLTSSRNFLKRNCHILIGVFP